LIKCISSNETPENRRIETAQARKEAKAIKSIQIEEGIPPKVIPNFNK